MIKARSQREKESSLSRQTFQIAPQQPGGHVHYLITSSYKMKLRCQLKTSCPLSSISMTDLNPQLHALWKFNFLHKMSISLQKAYVLYLQSPISIYVSLPRSTLIQIWSSTTYSISIKIKQKQKLFTYTMHHTKSLELQKIVTSQQNVIKSCYNLSPFSNANSGLSIHASLTPLWSISTQVPENQHKTI